MRVPTDRNSLIRIDPTKGYNNLLEYRFSKILPAIKAHPTKVITNMGAANPQAATDKVIEMAQKAGLSGLKVATVNGDDVTTAITKFGDRSRKKI